MQLSYQVIQARHQFFDWKLETRRRKNSPSAPIAFEKSNKTIGSYLTPPVFLKSLHDLRGVPTSARFKSSRDYQSIN
jgi:hypothetical protein